MVYSRTSQTKMDDLEVLGGSFYLVSRLVHPSYFNGISRLNPLMGELIHLNDSWVVHDQVLINYNLYIVISTKTIEFSHFICGSFLK